MSDWYKEHINLEVDKMSEEELIEALIPKHKFAGLDFWVFCHAKMIWRIYHLNYYCEKGDCGRKHKGQFYWHPFHYLHRFTHPYQSKLLNNSERR